MNLVLCVDHEWTTNFGRGTLILSLSAKCTDSKNRFLKIALIFSLFLKIALIFSLFLKIALIFSLFLKIALIFSLFLKIALNFSLFLPMQNLMVVNVHAFHNLYISSSSDATYQNRCYQIC